MSTEVVTVHNGLGRHVYYLSPEQIKIAAKFGVYTIMFALISITFTKLSFSIYLLRLVKWNKTLVYVLYAIIVFTLFEYLVGIVLIQTQCHPTEKISNPAIPGNCVGSGAQIRSAYIRGCESNAFMFRCVYLQSLRGHSRSLYSQANAWNIATSAFTDLLLAMLPVYLIWDVQISFRNKLSICCLTGLGIL